jgi:hypothetical protein
MKACVYPIALSLCLISSAGTASEPQNKNPASAPIRCYEQAWGSKENPGLGLNVGQAIELCSGVVDVDKVIKCFKEAFAHPNDGGLGLNLGQAIRLCKVNSQLRN